MKTWIAFWTALVAILVSLVLIKNYHSYPQHTRAWKILKSVVDTVIILTTAIYLPVLLCAWCVLWLTRPIQNTGLRVTISVLAGIVIGFFAQVALEIVVLCSIFSVDLITGENGFWHNWKLAQAHERERIFNVQNARIKPGVPVAAGA